MNIVENVFTTTKSARYYTIGSVSKKIKNIWFVFHGYGELAKDFIKKFEILSNDENLTIAPEALNKFCLRGFSGKIGATWMTKESREKEIEDYVNMIENVYAEISNNFNLSKNKINVIGFSQGGHTAIRWLNAKQKFVNNLILWGSSLPRDINYQTNLTYWNMIKIKLVVGDKDRFITPDKLIEERSFLKAGKIDYEFIKYSGIHEIDEKTLKKIYKMIN